MTTPRVMFVNHTGTIAGAELVLLDVVRAWSGASAFLFEDGSLNAALVSKGLSVRLSRWGRGLTRIHRDSSISKVVPLVGRLCAIVFEIAAESRKHDILYANSQKAFVLAAIASIFVRRPLIWHLHDIISPEHFGAMQRRTQVMLANACASKVIVPSQAAATAFIAAGGKRELVEVVPNGLSLPAEPRTRSELRQSLDLPAGPLVGVFSRLAPWKGQHVVLEAITQLADVRCIVVGDALFGEQAYALELKQIVLERGLTDRVRFLGHRSDVPELMKAVDVMVHPSIDPEPFGRTLVEAMLAGVPVIATNAGAAPDILEGGRAGTLVPRNDASALARAIATVLAKPETLRGQLEYALLRAEAQYSMARMLDGIGLVIRNLQAGAAA